MRIGITGATGLIGNAFGKLAAAHGHELIAFVRSPEQAKLDWAAEVLPFAPGSDRPLQAEGLGALVHLAGEPVLGLWTEAKKQRIRASRVDLTQKITRCFAEIASRPETLICASAVGYYGDRGDEILDEKAGRGDDFLAQVCVDWEAAARRAEQLGVRVISLRTGLVLASQGGMLPTMKRGFAYGLGGKLGQGTQWMPWIHIQDEVRLILWLLENKEISGAVNLSAPNPVTNAEFTQTLAQLMHRPSILNVPDFVLKNLPGGLGNAIIASQRAIPGKALQHGFEFDFPFLKDALGQILAEKV